MMINGRTDKIGLAVGVVLFLVAGCTSAQSIKISGLPGETPPPRPVTVTERNDTGDGVLVAKLSNHMTVIIKVVRNAPVVNVRCHVGTGGLHEGPWLGAGISHLTEHLVAEGAMHVSQADGGPMESKTAASRVDKIGGQSNAYTSLDRTVYFISAASDKTDDCIDLVADWMARPKISEADFKREHGVVQRELEKGADSPDRQLHYAHMVNLYRRHPAAVPVIGFIAPLAALTYKDVLDYHHRMYVPQDMVFCVVGDVDADAALKRICKAMAGFKTGLQPNWDLPPVADLAGVRRVVRPMPAATEDMEDISFLTISLLDDDLYALDVLSYILTNGPASRLAMKIKREKIVTDIDSWSWTPDWGRGPFTIHFRCAPGRADAAEKAILAELRKIITDGVTDDELARAKRQKTADFVYSQQTVDSIAETLASDYQATGDVNFSRRYTKNIQSVTAEQVQAAAKKYFHFDRMAITRIVPTAKTTAASAATTRPTAAAETQMFTLPNGLRVVLHPTDTVGLVSMTFVTTGGLLAETPETNGLGSLMTELSTKGAGKRTAEQIAAFFDQAGGGISGNCGNNSFYWRATVLDDSFTGAMGIFADVIVRPTFPKKELDILRPEALADIARIDEDWSVQLQQFFRKEFFAGSPYAMLSIGSKAVVKSADTKQLAAWHKKYIHAESSVLTVYGNFDAMAAKKQIEKAFVDLPGGKSPITINETPVSLKHEEIRALKTDKQVAGIIVAVPGMTVTDLKDRIPLDVLDTIISGWRMPSGWLHNELRGRRLVYVVHAYNWPGLAPGAFITYAACQPDKAAEVVKIIRKDYARATTFTPAQEDIDRAVNTILTAELLENQSMSALSMQAALDELYGFGYDFRKTLAERYRKVTPADVQRVAKKYLGKPAMIIVTSPEADPLEQK